MGSAGVSWQRGASPAVAGTGLYARQVSGGSWAFTVLDALPGGGGLVSTSVSVGLAQRLFGVGRVAVFVPTAAGIGWSGANLGWNWSTGAMVVVRAGRWRVCPALRTFKGSVAGAYRVGVGVLVGGAW